MDIGSEIRVIEVEVEETVPAPEPMAETPPRQDGGVDTPRAT